MIAIARGSITEPHKLGPFIDDEKRVVEQLKAERVMKAVYRRAAGPGTVIIVEGESMDAVRERMNTLGGLDRRREATRGYRQPPAADIAMLA
jgi:hypothetical protein